MNCTSISGGRTSAYLAANYPTDYNVFALVRVDDTDCKFKDEKIRKLVEDRIQKPFIGTVEDDVIIYTILDLEQFIGREITWVSGITFEEVTKTKGGWLPNKKHRFCTTWMKLAPIFEWWSHNFTEPIQMHIGYRSKETKRANKMLSKTVNGILEFDDEVTKTPWQIPRFPLIEDGIQSYDIINYWENKPVRFADYNNCVGCFNRSPIFLRHMSQLHPDKFGWFEKQEIGRTRGLWKYPFRYEKIKNIAKNLTFSNSEFTECDSGYCGL